MTALPNDTDIEIERLKARVNDAYRERDMLAAALAATVGGWTVELDDRGRPVLVFDLPDTGQVSFHVAFEYHDIEGFDVTLGDDGEWAGVTSERRWDGHDKATALDRLAGYTERCNLARATPAVTAR